MIERPTIQIQWFLDEFEEHNPIDLLIAMVLQAAISVVGSSLELDIMNKTKDEKYDYTARDANKVAVKALRDIADNMEKQSIDFDKLN